MSQASPSRTTGRAVLGVAVVLVFALGDTADAAKRRRRGKKGKKPAATKVVEPAVEDVSKQDASGETVPEIPAAGPDAEAAVDEDITSEELQTQTKEGDQDGPDAGGSSLGLRLAPKVGTLIPTNRLKVTYFVALEVAYVIAPLSDMLGLGLDLGVATEFAFSQPTLSGKETDAVVGEYSYKMKQQLMTLSFEAFAGYEVIEALTVYGGLGYGFYFLQSKVTAFGQTNTEAQTRSGTQLRAGAGYYLGLGDIFVEARYHYTNLGFLTTGKVNGGGFVVSAGYRLKL